MKHRIALWVVVFLGGCGQTYPRDPHAGHLVDSRNTADPDIQAVVAIHGGAGPWAVAGYRMGRYALRRLGLQRGSFDLEVEHHSPHEVQYSCIADGAAVATGASMGKLNLSLADAPRTELHTVYRRRSNGMMVSLRISAAFEKRFMNVPRDHLADAGREVHHLRDDEIFEEVP